MMKGRKRLLRPLPPSPRLRRTGRGLAMTAFMLAATLIFLITGCGRKEPPKTDAASQGETGDNKAMEDGVAHKVLSFNLEGITERGEKKWEVIGRTARSISADEIKLGNIVAKSFGDDEAVIVADEGIYNKSKNNVRLEKNVKAIIENSGSAIKDQIGFSVKGPSKKDDAQAAAGKPKQKKKMIITCDGEVEFDYAKNLIYFKDNVKVKSDDGDIDADKITVNLDPVTRKINDIVCEGHVKITQKENVAYSDTAKYKESEKKVSLSGNPKIVMVQEGDGVIKEQITER